MAITTAKIDEQIRKLQELKKLVADPEMLPLLESLLVQNGNGNAPAKHSHTYSRKRVGRQLKRGNLVETVEKTIADMSGRLTAPMVARTMAHNGFKFASQKPKVAVNGVLRNLVKNGMLKIVVEGSGRAPNQYERIGKGAGD